MRRTILIWAAVVVGGLAIGAAFASTPFGGDDTGFVPPDSPKGPITKCELAAASNISKLIGCVIKCHEARASGKLADATAEETCEQTDALKSCLAKYNKVMAKILAKGGCPPCLDQEANANLAISLLDGNNSAGYCASPSGAFLDGTAN